MERKNLINILKIIPITFDKINRNHYIAIKKIMKKLIFLAGLGFMYLILMIISTESNKYDIMLRNQFMKVEVGDIYTISYHHNNDNPFIPKKPVDTIKVIDIKNGYVKYRYKNSYYYSRKLKYFKDRITEKVN